MADPNALAYYDKLQEIFKRVEHKEGKNVLQIQMF